MKKLVLVFFVLFAVLISLCNTALSHSSANDITERKNYVGVNLSGKVKVLEDLKEGINE